MRRYLRNLPTVLSAAAGLVFAACADSPVLTESDGDERKFAVGEGGVHWQDNVLEFSHDGKQYRLERDQQDAAEVQLYVNNSLKTTVEVVGRSGGEITEMRLNDPSSSGWVEVDAEGNITNTSYGGGHGCTPDPGDPDCPAFTFAMPNDATQFAALRFGPCSQYGYNAIGAAAGTVVGGVGFAATLSSPPAWGWTVGFAAATATAAVATVSFSVSWIACKVDQDGSGDDDDDGRCEYGVCKESMPTGMGVATVMAASPCVA